MTRIDSKVNFQLSVFPEEKAMIKADAKALGMPVARYVVMLCKLANNAYREEAAELMAGNVVRSVMRGAKQALDEGVPK